MMTCNYCGSATCEDDCRPYPPECDECNFKLEDCTCKRKIDTHYGYGRKSHFFKGGCLLTTQGSATATLILGDLPSTTTTRKHAANVLRHLRKETP